MKCEESAIGCDCTKPFKSEDFDRLDKNRDEQLRHGENNEVTPETIDCFVERFVHTQRGIRDNFKMGISLWEETRKRLLSLSKKKNPPKLKRELEYMLEHRFSDRIPYGGGGIATKYDGKSSKSKSGGVQESLDKSQFELSGSGYFGVNLHMGDHWRFNSGISLTGHFNWGRQDIVSGTEKKEEPFEYQGVTGNGYVNILSNDGQFSFSGSGDYYHSFNTPADEIKESSNASVSLSSKNISFLGGSLSIEASYSYYSSENTPPPDGLDFGTSENENHNATAQITISGKQFGILLDGFYTNADSIYSFGMNKIEQGEGNIKTRYTFSGGRFDAGLGGGSAVGESYSKLRDEHNVVDSASINGMLLLLLDVSDELDISISPEAYGTYSEGTIKGWYPSWSLVAGLKFHSQLADLNLSATYSGSKIDLNEQQETHGAKGKLTTEIRPLDELEISAEVSGGYSDTIGYWAGNSWDISGDISIEYQIPTWRYLTLILEGEISFEESRYDNGSRSNEGEWSVQLKADINI